MKKAIKCLSVALVVTVLAMVLASTYTVMTGNAIYKSGNAVPGITQEGTILRNTFRLKGLEILRTNAKRRTRAEQQASAAEQAEEAN